MGLFNSRKNHESGITLIEIILVVAIMSAAISLTFVDSDNHRGVSFRSSRDLLVASIQHSRAQAMNNICLGAGCSDGKPHGVHINTDGNGFVTSYVIFQNAIYDFADSTNAVIDVGGNASRNVSLLSGSVANIYFEQLSGDSIPASLTLSNGVENSIITINSEGRITWTN